jgi:hypothetical protein
VSQNGIGRIEVKNCGTVGNSLVGVGLVNFAQLNQILRKHHCQDLSLEVATTLLQREQREISFMPIVDDQKADLQAICTGNLTAKLRLMKRLRLILHSR